MTQRASREHCWIVDNSSPDRRKRSLRYCKVLGILIVELLRLFVAERLTGEAGAARHRCVDLLRLGYQFLMDGEALSVHCREGLLLWQLAQAATCPSTAFFPAKGTSQHRWASVFLSSPSVVLLLSLTHAHSEVVLPFVLVLDQILFSTISSSMRTCPSNISVSTWLYPRVPCVVALSPRLGSMGASFFRLLDENESLSPSADDG